MHPESTSDLRRRYAESVLRTAGVDDPRIGHAFATIPREAFLPPPPWTTISQGVATSTNNVADLYRNVLVALDRSRGINNGEPALHASWLAAIDPRPGEHVVHVGAGGGYYTAILAALVAPGGAVDAYEIHPDLARVAARNLASWEGVRVHEGSAVARRLPPADIVYVNAGVVAPDSGWLRALVPGGRLIFPWQPEGGWGTAFLVTHRAGGFSAKPVMSVGFIACSGEKGRGTAERPAAHADIRTRSIWLTDERRPDRSATAVYDDVWFSADPVE